MSKLETISGINENTQKKYSLLTFQVRQPKHDRQKKKKKGRFNDKQSQTTLNYSAINKEVSVRE